MNLTHKTNSLSEDCSLDLQEKGLAKVIEITYFYPPLKNDKTTKCKFNDTIFFELLGQEVDWNSVSFDEIQQRIASNYQLVEEFLKEKIIEYQEDIKTIGNESDEKSLLDKGALEYNVNVLQISLLGLPFELEKAGLSSGLGTHEKIQILNNQKEYEKLAGMSQISENPKYANVCYKFLADTLAESSIADVEKDNFQQYLEKLANDAGEDFLYTPKNGEQSETKKFVNRLKNIHVPRETVIQMFQWAMEINGIQKTVIEADVDFIYDGPDALYYPKKKAFDSRSMDRVLALIDHEIEKHFYNEKVHEEIHGEGAHRYAGNLEKEEGLAVTGEKILLGEDLSDISVQFTFIMTYFGEIFCGKDFLKFLCDISKIIPQADIVGRYYRMKRGKDLDLPGVQEKDGLYSKGVMEIIEFIENGGSINDLFLGKHSLADLDKVKALRGDKKTGIPIGISEILMYNLMGRYGYNIAETFDMYIVEKYGKHDGIGRKLNRDEVILAKKMRNTLMGIIDENQEGVILDN